MNRPDGLLLVDKPLGLTSFDVVARLRKRLGVKRIGHTGTLDPLATGLLPVCVGEATKLVAYLTAHDKRYVATVRLGTATDTLDAEGRVTATDPVERVEAVDAAAFAAVLPQFTGRLSQRPPAYSAIKVDGRRLHERARAGEAVEAPVREVTIESLVLLDAAPPDFTFEVHCGKGTYVRSLAADLAAALGLHGHLVALRRTAVGGFRVEDAEPLERLVDVPGVLETALRPLAQAVGDLPALVLSGAALSDVRHGRSHTFALGEPGIRRALDESGALVALLELAADGVARVLRGFAPRSAETLDADERLS